MGRGFCQYCTRDAAGGGFVTDVFNEISTRRTPRAVLTSFRRVALIRKRYES